MMQKIVEKGHKQLVNLLKVLKEMQVQVLKSCLEWTKISPLIPGKTGSDFDKRPSDPRVNTVRITEVRKQLFKTIIFEHPFR